MVLRVAGSQQVGTDMKIKEQEALVTVKSAKEIFGITISNIQSRMEKDRTIKQFLQKASIASNTRVIHLLLIGE